MTVTGGIKFFQKSKFLFSEGSVAYASSGNNAQHILNMNRNNKWETTVSEKTTGSILANAQGTGETTEVYQIPNPEVVKLPAEVRKYALYGMIGYSNDGLLARVGLERHLFQSNIVFTPFKVKTSVVGEVNYVNNPDTFMDYSASSTRVLAAVKFNFDKR